MDGFLDELNQAFFTIDLGQGPLDFQIDTGFSGTFVIGEELFEVPNAVPAGKVDADLAADQNQSFDSYDIVFDWLNEETQCLVLVGPGKDCLIGTAMFNPHRLEIDYGRRSVCLVQNADW